MKLLILTQKIDKEDPILGFFHNWILELSKKFEKISVICLEKGEFNLPDNVKVFSLGKEKNILSFSILKYLLSRARYITNFYIYILGLHADYDAVFVHMNQEYIILGGFIWKVIGKKIYLWRNHPKGSLLTYIAVWFSNKVFCTSKSSFTSKFKKTVLMPVGINTDFFRQVFNGQQSIVNKNKILFLGRIAPIKNVHIFIKALAILNEKNINFEASIYGDSPVKDNKYYQLLKIMTDKLNLNEKVKFYKAVPNYKTPEIYNSYEIFINLTPAGSFDKTILEASACGAIPIVANKSLKGEIDDNLILNSLEPNHLAEKIEFWIKERENKKIEISKKLQKYVLENHSLNILIDKLLICLNENKKR